MIFSHLRSLPCCMAVRHQSGAKQQLGNRNHARPPSDTNHHEQQNAADEKSISFTSSSISTCIDIVASQHPFP